MWYQEVERKEEEGEEEKDKQWASTLSLEGEQKVSSIKIGLLISQTTSYSLDDWGF